MKFENIELEGIDAKGKTHNIKLADLKGKNIILYFYPQDETPICTKEAEHFRDAMSKLPKDTVIIGVSPDNIESHKQFLQRHDLNFSILSDAEQKLARAFKNIKENVQEKTEEIQKNIGKTANKIKEKIQDKKVEMKKKHMQMEVENKPITMRSTFIIGKDGKLVKEMRDIDIKGHVDEVIEFVKNLK